MTNDEKTETLNRFNTLPAQVRKYFGLDQQELADYLGTSRPLLAHLEAGRRALASRVLLRLNSLAALLPAGAPARPAVPAPEVPPPGVPDADLLTARQDLEAELDTYQNRDSNLGYTDRQVARGKAETAALLTGVEAEIGMYTTMLATPGLSARLLKQNQSKLRRANDRRENLTDQGGARSGPARILAAVDAEQVDAQVVVLTDAQTQVTTHRATLPA
ncbi:hypothetical protein GCM10022408_05670 [Hymenobacter fastidiosus]|uniref:HTH cro/C1-type domain-containing protein n=1 Tax=Hymenobacter fastidiosus TaxID=486264 RepID=A0ABP7RHY9_9BACT